MNNLTITLNKISNTKVKVVLSMVFWGATFVCGRYLARNHHPFAIAFARFAIASAFFIPLMLQLMLQRGVAPPKPTPIQVFKILVLGATGIFAYNYFFFAGLALVPAGKASVIIAVNPAITALLASWIMRESLGWKKAAGAIVALLGAIVVTTKGELGAAFSGGLGKGELFLFGGVLSWVAYTLVGKLALKRIGPLHATGLSCVVGSLFLAPFAIESGLFDLLSTATLLDWGALFFMGFFATFIGFVWFYTGVREIGAAKTALYINLVPVVATVFGWLFLKETVDATFFLGAALVLAGLRLTQGK